MIITRQQKDHIRLNWPQYRLQFKKDGTVMAAKRERGSTWGVLYRPPDTQKHIQTIKS